MQFSLMNKADTIDVTDKRIIIGAPAESDFFCDMMTGTRKYNAPLYYTKVRGDFILRCLVTPQFRDVYDAGGLMVFTNNRKWIKLAFEKTDLGYTSCVAVVTNGISDDSNGEQIDAAAVWLQIVRSRDNWCLHYSYDKSQWKMIRYFRLKLGKQVKAGMLSQSPAGKGCLVTFRHCELQHKAYQNIRRAE